MNTRTTLALVSLLGFNALLSAADEVKTQRDIEYARVGDVALKFDLYVPANATSPPLVVWVHGGAWKGGSKTILLCCRSPSAATQSPASITGFRPRRNSRRRFTT